MRRSSDELITLHQLSLAIAKPAHRVIHLCEQGVVRPRIDSAGRGSMRRFDRENMFRVLLALELQDAGVEVPRLRTVMQTLDQFQAIPEIRQLRQRLLGPQDLVQLTLYLSEETRPVLIVLRPPEEVILVTPKFSVPARPGLKVGLRMSPEFIFNGPVCTVANLTTYAHAVR